MTDRLEEFLREHPLTDSFDVLIPDLSGVLRGKRLPAATVRSALAGEAFFTTTVYSIDTPGANVAESGLVWEEGDADRHLRLDPATLRPVPWRAGGAQILGGMNEPNGSAFFAESPRPEMMRLNYSNRPPELIEEGLARLGRVVRRRLV